MSAHVLFIHVNLLAPLHSPDTIPISEASILAHVKRHGFSGQILGDFADRPLKAEVLAHAIRRHNPVALGFTAYQENMQQIRLWARFAKKLYPAIQVILGGPQAMFMPGEALRHMPECDFLCRGEGEDVMLGLVRAIAGGGDVADVADVPGLSFLRGDKVVETGPARGATDLDTYASPYLMDLIDLTHKDRAILLTTRGCSYDCAFCYTPRASDRRIRTFSLERILEEMRYLKSRGIRAFWFADTNFSFSRKRLVAFLEGVIQDVSDITFWCQTRYDLVDGELLALLKRAGADNVAYGLESANPEVLRRIRKPIDLGRLSEVIRLTQEAGIHVELFSMFGLPGETFAQALATLDFVKKKGVAVDGNSISQQAHLFFGTPLNDDSAAFGIRPFRRTRPAYLSVCRDYETDAMSAEQIRRISLIWRLNRQDFIDDVRAQRNLFHRASLIVENRDAFAQWPEAERLLASIYLALEEYGAARDCMQRLRIAFPARPDAARLSGEPFSSFRLIDRRARNGFKVIYDCRGTLNGQVVSATWSRFQEAVIGEKHVLPDFERNLEGLAPGDDRQFDVTFPSDYPNSELAGKVVLFRVHVHYVMEPVTLPGLGALEDESLSNDYGLADTEGLRQDNINLYYKVLHSANRRETPLDPADGLMLANLYLKLGFVARAEALVSGFAESSGVVLTHAAHLFRMNGHWERALALLDRVGQNGPRQRLIRAQALCDGGLLQEAESIAGNMVPLADVPLAELRVKLAAELALPLEIYLEREEALLDAKTRTLL